jgi:protocatechuate 3,4-dioxygenase beta subunit
MGYAPTYYPGTTNTAEAGRIALGLGAEAAADFSLVTGRAATISGTAFDSRGRPFPNVAVREEIRGDGFARFGGAKTATVAADGTFSIRDVTPGEYKLVASTRDTDHPEAAIVPITVESVDLTDVVLTGSEGGSITGQVLTDAGAVPEIPRLLVSIGEPLIGQPDPTLLSVFRNPGFSPLAADGTFSIKGIFGRSPLRVTLPDEWMVKSIVHDGLDITDAPIELRSGEVMSDVRVIVTDQVTTVSGQTTDDKGRPVSDATIVVFADDAQKWSAASRAVRAVRPDQQGRYQVKGLPTGEYLAIALDYVEEGLWNDPDFLESLRRDAQKAILRDTTAQELALKVLTPDK